jgi:hypothetical protein
MWQFAGRGNISDLLRTVVVRLARAMGGGVDFWMGLPIHELLQYMLELGAQLHEENEAIEKGRR